MRTTARMEMLGTTSPITTLVAEHIAGTRTDSRESATASRTSAWRWLSGTSKIPSFKERLFGLTGPQGNHGEDVKKYYFYLDNTPTHSYMRMLYKYPQVAYPYERLVTENEERGYHDPEFELIHALSDAFQEGRYFDVYVEYAKASEEDILCRITAVNRGPHPAPIHILPHLWYRNTWSWGYARPKAAKPYTTQA